MTTIEIGNNIYLAVLIILKKKIANNIIDVIIMYNVCLNIS